MSAQQALPKLVELRPQVKSTPHLVVVDEEYLRRYRQRLIHDSNHPSLPTRRLKAPAMMHSGQILDPVSIKSIPVQRKTIATNTRPLTKGVILAFLRWLAAFVLVVGVGATAGYLLSTSFVTENSAASTTTYTVTSGDTLWSLAQTMNAPGMSQEDRVAQLMALNNLSDSHLQVGASLRIPRTQ